MELPTAHSLNVSWSIFTNVNWEFESIVHDDKTSYPVYITHTLCHWYTPKVQQKFKCML